MNRLKAFKLANNNDQSLNALHQLEVLAADGDFFAQFYLAEIYFYGERVKKNLSKSVQLYKVSFENGCGDSAIKLGDLYHSRCVFHNIEELNISKNDEYANKLYLVGFELLKKQFEQGDHFAADLISVCYSSGKGVQYDLDKAKEWMKIYQKKSDWYLK